MELDSDEGCLTYAAAGEVSAEDAWEDNEALEEEWEEAGFAPDEDEDEDDLEEEDEEDDLDDE
ncbi:MAG: hypothetical protein KIS88_02870 [Anaerolineales bacterium]|nr:hypothetical protein [Anaerolineales bacterium]